MNAKKIMGAVLVALLAAALFTGAVAAADKGTYFAYQSNINESLNGVWMNGDSKVTIANGNMSAVPVAGTYTNGDDSIYVTNPTAAYVASGLYDTTNYIVNNGGIVYQKSKVTITATGLNKSIVPDMLKLIKPNGAVEYVDGAVANAKWFNDTGVWKIQAVWNETSAGKFVTGAPLPIVDSAEFTFNVVKPSDATITGSVDTVYAGDAVSVTIKGTPGVKYAVNLTGFAGTQTLNQIVMLTPNVAAPNTYLVNFTMPSAAEVTFQFVTAGDAEDEVKLGLIDESTDSSKIIDEVVVAIAKPELTVTLGATSYFIGNEIKVVGSSNIAVPDNAYTFNITGTNFEETALEINEVDTEYDGKTFTVYLKTLGVNTTEGKKLDVGTYTIKMYDTKLVKTLTVALKQPFISIIDAPEVVVQGEKAEFVINAEAAANVSAYFFGTNFFKATGPKAADKDVSNQFTIKIEGKDTNNMSTGQYFAVFQHPMYDQYYNIYAENGIFYLKTNGSEATGTYLFSTDARQTANAAQALCDNLDSQTIDDMYVKASFFIVGEDESFSISEIPTTIAQGETLTISGVSTANAGNEVTVEMISTAFAAVPKETVGSAAFILVTTEVAEDGTWEITMDTSDLNVDEYSLKVAVSADGKSSTWKNVNINVVEADEPVNPEQPEEPEQPEQPEEPVAPATPGFGALAALAGLGAVAVLLLRRE